MKILSFGSLNYDYTYEVEHFLAPKETLAAKSMQRGFGGKGANQSIAFARAGLSVYHAGRVGADGQPFVDSRVQFRKRQRFKGCFPATLALPFPEVVNGFMVQYQLAKMVKLAAPPVIIRGNFHLLTPFRGE